MKAFPNQGKTKYGVGGIEYKEVTDEGMDLRDYFAAKAMPILLEDYLKDMNWEKEGDHIFQYIDITTTVSYKIADSMMKARTK